MVSLDLVRSVWSGLVRLGLARSGSVRLAMVRSDLINSNLVSLGQLVCINKHFVVWRKHTPTYHSYTSRPCILIGYCTSSLSWCTCSITLLRDAHVSHSPFWLANLVGRRVSWYKQYKINITPCILNVAFALVQLVNLKINWTLNYYVNFHTCAVLPSISRLPRRSLTDL
jgi:hypothetical protein